METNSAQWLTNQYPENWSAKVASDALRKIIEGKGKPLDSERCLSVQSPKDVKFIFKSSITTKKSTEKHSFIKFVNLFMLFDSRESR